MPVWVGAWLASWPTSCAPWPCPMRRRSGRSRRCGPSWSRSAPRWSATAVTSHSNWPRSRCRGGCSGWSSRAHCPAAGTAHTGMTGPGRRALEWPTGEVRRVRGQAGRSGAACGHVPLRPPTVPSAGDLRRRTCDFRCGTGPRGRLWAEQHRASGECRITVATPAHPRSGRHTQRFCSTIIGHPPCSRAVSLRRVFSLRPQPVP